MSSLDSGHDKAHADIETAYDGSDTQTDISNRNGDRRGGREKRTNRGSMNRSGELVPLSSVVTTVPSRPAKPGWLSRVDGGLQSRNLSTAKRSVDQDQTSDSPLSSRSKQSGVRSDYYQSDQFQSLRHCDSHRMKGARPHCGNGSAATCSSQKVTGGQGTSGDQQESDDGKSGSFAKWFKKHLDESRKQKIKNMSIICLT